MKVMGKNIIFLVHKRYTNIDRDNYITLQKGLDQMDIKQLIGEATEYDKKEKLEIKRPKSWCKSISAFANSFGGFLVFGVTNNDEFIGMPEAEKDAELISEYIKTYLNPIPEFILSFKKVDGKKFILVKVNSGDQTPYYYEGNLNMNFLIWRLQN